MIRSTDLFINTSNPTLVKSQLQTYGITFDGSAGIHDNFVIDWIGKIPATLDSNTGEVLTWQAGEFFNVRIQDKPKVSANTIKTAIQSMSLTVLPTPATPYRVFS